MSFTAWLRQRRGEDLGRVFRECVVDGNGRWPEDGRKEEYLQALPDTAYAPYLDKLWMRYRRDEDGLLRKPVAPLPETDSRAVFLPSHRR